MSYFAYLTLEAPALFTSVIWILCHDAYFYSKKNVQNVQKSVGLIFSSLWIIINASIMIGDLADFTINLQYIEHIKIHIRNLHPVKIVENFLLL